MLVSTEISIPTDKGIEKAKLDVLKSKETGAVILVIEYSDLRRQLSANVALGELDEDEFAMVTHGVNLGISLALYRHGIAAKTSKKITLENSELQVFALFPEFYKLLKEEGNDGKTVPSLG